MSRPLHKGASHDPVQRPPGGQAGLWFDKFCNQWNVQGSSWTMESGKHYDKGRSQRKKDNHKRNPKLEWIRTVTGEESGTRNQIDELARRAARLVERRGGRFFVFTSESRFVTGLGRSHPVENGFAWHPTLGTPYLPGSSIKGAVRAWIKADSSSPIPEETIRRLFGDLGSAGSICFLDAVPVAPVLLESDVMTPHYAGWTEKDNNLPGDWRSPVPVPFLVTASGTSLLFGIVPCGDVTGDDLETVMSWLRSALVWSGSGAKTAVGYGRFRMDDAGTDGLKQRLREQELKHEKQIRAEREAAEREARRAAMDPIEREIEEIIEGRPNKHEPAVTTIIRNVKEERWSGSERTEVARWLERQMKADKQWKEKSAAKNPLKDKDYQQTLLIKNWLDEGQA